MSSGEIMLTIILNLTCLHQVDEENVKQKRRGRVSQGLKNINGKIGLN